MAEETGSIRSIGAMGSMDDYVSTQDHPQASQTQTVEASVAAAAVADPAARPSEQTVRSAVEEINAHLAGVNRVLTLKVDPRSGYTVVLISNAQTGEVLQQMPTEDYIQLEQMLARWSHGGNVLMDVEA